MKMKYRGWEARIFQHEYDHIEGILYPDRMTEEGKAEVQPRINELIDEFRAAGYGVHSLKTQAISNDIRVSVSYLCYDQNTPN